MHKHQAYSMCRKYLHHYVHLTMRDGRRYDGIIEKVDRDHVYLAVPRGDGFRKAKSGEGGDRQFGYSLAYPDFYPGYGYPGVGYPIYPSYGYPGLGYGYPGYYPRRRFRRLILPLSFLTGVALGRIF